MQQGYTMASKKRSIAKKMGLTMNGDGTGYGSGMKYRGTGKNSGKGGAMKSLGTGMGVGKMAQRPIMSKKNPMVGKHIYTQNGD